MYESSEGQAPSAQAAFAALLDELFTGPRVTYAPVRESPVYYGGHSYRERRHRRFVLHPGTDLDDPR
jgi:hypothetical protein